jgi:hypothetical protein
MSSQDDYSGVIPADDDILRIANEINDLFEGEAVADVLSALQMHLIFCMSLVPSEQRQHIAREWERDMPRMLGFANMQAPDHACH